MEILDTASSPENGVHFSDAEIAVVKKALHAKLFRRAAESYEVRLPKFQQMVTELSEMFGIPEVKVVGVVERSTGYGVFNRETNTIETEKFLSLTTVLFTFAVALMTHKPELAPSMAEIFEGADMSGKLQPLAFALSAFKQAAPRMFDDAKARGMLIGTSTPYTDDGRIRPVVEGALPPEETGETDAPEGATQELPNPNPAPQSRQNRTSQRPDIDPENRVDRGNGAGED